MKINIKNKKVIATIISALLLLGGVSTGAIPVISETGATVICELVGCEE